MGKHRGKDGDKKKKLADQKKADEFDKRHKEFVAAQRKKEAARYEILPLPKNQGKKSCAISMIGLLGGLSTLGYFIEHAISVIV
jgi:predicted  nucleic acid-binding Zn-ribbon protein